MGAARAVARARTWAQSPPKAGSARAKNAQRSLACHANGDSPSGDIGMAAASDIIGRPVQPSVATLAASDASPLSGGGAHAPAMAQARAHSARESAAGSFPRVGQACAAVSSRRPWFAPMPYPDAQKANPNPMTAMNGTASRHAWGFDAGESTALTLAGLGANGYLGGSDGLVWAGSCRGGAHGARTDGKWYAPASRMLQLRRGSFYRSLARGSCVAAIALGGCGSRTDLGTASPSESCSHQGAPGSTITDFYLLVDRSTSMNCPLGLAGEMCGLPGGPDPPIDPTPPDRWTNVVDAIDGFLSTQTNATTSLGLGFFPPEVTGATGPCETATYTDALVPIEALPGVAPAIESALRMQVPAGGTPTVPALQGSLEYARRRMIANPARDVSVVLMTDGIPNFCASDVPGTVIAARSGVAGTPPVRTFVVGIGPALEALNEVAMAGGTRVAHLVDTRGDWVAELTAVLDSISNSCGP